MTVRDLTRPTAGAKGPVSAVFSRRFGPLCAMKEQLQAIVTVLSLVNPAICGAMFAQIEANRSRGQQTADATKAVLATTVILTVSALIGPQLLNLFGVSLDAFMVAGGGVLAWMGFSMLSGQGNLTDVG